MFDEQPSQISTLVTAALTIADDHAPRVIEAECVKVEKDGDQWFDLESSDEDLAIEVAYCSLRGLIKRHPENSSLVQTLEL